MNDGKALNSFHVALQSLLKIHGSEGRKSAREIKGFLDGMSNPFILEAPFLRPLAYPFQSLFQEYPEVAPYTEIRQLEGGGPLRRHGSPG